MCYIILRNINDMYVQIRESKLSEAIRKAEDLIECGHELNLIVCKEIDNQSAKKLDWTQPSWKREYICKIS